MRYPAPDRIRGLALLGILVVNLGFMVGPIGLVLDPPSAQADVVERAGWWLLRLGFESKFMALFALLFGASAMLAGSNPQRHEARMLRLFPIGVLHGLLLFFGDILHAYAVWGFPLARLGKVHGKWLLLLGSIAFTWYLAVTAVVHSFEVQDAGVPNSGPPWLRLATASADPGDPAFIALETEVVRAGPSVDSSLYRMVVFTYVGIKGVFQTGWRVFALFLRWAVADPTGVVGYAPSIPTSLLGNSIWFAAGSSGHPEHEFRNAVCHTDHPGPRVGIGAVVTGPFCEFGPLAR